MDYQYIAAGLGFVSMIFIFSDSMDDNTVICNPTCHCGPTIFEENYYSK